jgi:plastocyanin
VDRSGHSKPSADIVVWLEPLHPAETQPVVMTRARLLQKDKTFWPHVLAVQVNTQVDFPNADPIFHNAFSNYDGQIFDIGLYPPGQSRAVRFRRPGIVRIFCNIHPSMSAVIVVLDTPYFTTIAPGSFNFDDVAPGAYDVHVFDERAQQQTDLPRITVGTEGTVDVPAIHLSEAGYVQTPHKNKYGRDYPPAAETYGTNGPPQ